MNIEEFRDYCLKKPGVTEEFPFGPETLVFKVMGKMFALTNIELFESVNLKCEPGKAIELREKYPSVLPGYHMSKKHWNTIMMNDLLNDQLIFEWIDNSYNLVVDGLTKKERERLSESN